MSDDLDRVRQALLWHAMDLRFHRPDVVLAFIDPAKVRLDRYGGPVGARQAVSDLLRAEPYLARRSGQGADAGAGRAPDTRPLPSQSMGPNRAIRVAAGVAGPPKGRV